MNLLELLKSMIGIRKRQDEPNGAPKDGASSQAAMESALLMLQQMLRPAVFGEIGGERPEKDNRARSWWGGNFLGAEGEAVPVCEASGRPMHPLLQIRLDELAEALPAFSGIAFITIWMDLEDVPLDDAENGKGFAVRTYPAIAGLVPIGPGYRESDALPTFPVLWRASAPEQPSWDDIAFELPDRVAQSNDSDWFFKSRYATEANQHRRTCPVKLGGWPTWIQGDNWPEDGEFCLQIDSNDKGRLYVGDAGSIYLFRTPGGWVIRSDFY
ncbi:uncharacterized protein YwqG [Rhizobium pisi]|uniref:DUF1963 domain-containing protein n=1 Tax=Rhizobium pisi TaxID=574561 RepID=A0A3R9BHA4_9HYPH|nr:DUF1963 domain-containing protein [Rhizobium pisi]MBB3137769.1 uncharacterized protein YwqG [Rhizobium pisi]RSB65918.1 DUF1963 domain-containing protein [Rhizobium pisi]TCA41690.1 DUF1963 domain-containing protein [Rhizobium pisi]